MALKKYITLRDSGTPTTSVNLYLIKRYQVRPNVSYDNSETILANGTLAVDYGEDKKVWSLEIDIRAGVVDDWTAANLTDLQTLYALRTTQTIQLVENWKESGTVYNVHFKEFKILSHDAGSDKYWLLLKEE